VVQGTTLVIRIGGTVFVLRAVTMRVMVVHVSNPAPVSKVGSDVLLGLDGMLNVHAHQRHNAGGLGQ
jgi:hypothetical protein